MKRILLAALGAVGWQLPAGAHVKWFLGKSEAAVLAEPKPQLFTQLGLVNVGVITLGALLLGILVALDRRWKGWRVNQHLLKQFEQAEPVVNSAIAVLTGLLLIKSGVDMSFMVPSLHLHHCCIWIARTEIAIGIAFVVGLFVRPAALAMLLLLFWSFVKFSTADCFDLLPMYGIAGYLMVIGRTKYCLDYWLRIAPPAPPVVRDAAYTVLRWKLGLGLMYLGLDEKLLHPQLSMDVLRHASSLNFMHGLGMGNDLFVLCGGVTEVALGLMLACGIFPRAVMVTLAILFAATTSVFGWTEFVGHMPFYAVMVSIIYRGAATFDLAELKALLTGGIRGKLHPLIRAATSTHA